MRIAPLGTLALLGAGCTPLVTGYHQEKDLHITGECAKEGGSTYVKVLISSTAGDPPWMVTFMGGQPEDLIMEATPGFTRLRWKLGKDHLQAVSIQPYELQITSGDRMFRARITFRTTSEQILSAVVGSLIRIH
ncbi:hypothetical protein [Geothrix sp.]|jgi:hypothetical protein|uniref:hypothetical protein n=1 Tax=Geothrix sp. TaxID=1962974 RepID=UPI0025C126D2|nr:hypothetical protein [Geothrix sp.]